MLTRLTQTVFIALLALATASSAAAQSWSNATPTDPNATPSAPFPADGEARVSPYINPRWQGAPDAQGYIVECGTQNPPTYFANVAQPTFEPGTLETNTTFYWKITEYTATSTVAGPVWSFKTGDGTPPGLYTSNRFVLTADGKKLLLRGLNNGFNKVRPATMVPEIAKTRANVLRPIARLEPLPNGFTLAEFEDLLVTIISNGIIPIVWVDDGSGPTNTLLRPELVDIVRRYEDRLIVVGFPEPRGYNDPARWVTEVKASITRFRDAGYQCPLTCMTHKGGRDLPSLLSNGLEIVQHDPMHNIIMCWQAYWGDNDSDTRNWYEDLYDMTLEQGLTSCAQLTYPVEVGLAAWDGSGDGRYQWVDYPTIMALCLEFHLGYDYWDWYNPWALKYSMTTDGTFGSWNSSPSNIFGADFGYQIAVGHPGSIYMSGIAEPGGALAAVIPAFAAVIRARRALS